MSIFFNISFVLIEWLAITGLAQCLLIIVYMLLRLYNWRQAVVPVLYFLALAWVFCMQFSFRLEYVEDIIRLSLWGGWAMIPPLNYLLIMQIASGHPPKFRYSWILLLPVLAAFVVFAANRAGYVCENEKAICSTFFEFLYIGNGIIGAISLLFLFGHSHLFEDIKGKAQGGYERYWLVISLILTNLAAVGINIYRVAQPDLTTQTADALLIIIALGFTYLATTMFFRIYPPAIDLRAVEEKKKKPANTGQLSDAEYALAEKIHDLMTLDKLYHEQSFSRADLARELNISENALSAIINTAFGKSFPQLLNEHRVEDAKRMLENPEIPIQTVAFEVGFNSLPSFNRVFKQMVGQSPSAFRNDSLG
ncbi:MAG: AraC family transcriptional regulator [Alphaproteobacteria bacterium]|nr:MAG: AraC family transcriptional regulator [Alphaproteobacteria bacterium]